MSALLKNILKPGYLRAAGCFLTSKSAFNVSSKNFARSLWHFPSVYDKNVIHKKMEYCNCGCQSMGIHTKEGGRDLSKAASRKIVDITQGEKELAEFLTEEIAAEKELRGENVPNEVNGFKIKINGSEVTFIKATGDEEIFVKFNVNHAVGEETEYDSTDIGAVSKDDAKPIINRPPFDVEIKRNGKVLGFRCSMVIPPPKDSGTEDAYNDLFAIDEVIICDGEWKDSNYRVPGEIMDGTLYDLLMNLLEDKGIGNELVEKLTSISTSYEHILYVNLLEQMQRFVKSAK